MRDAATLEARGIPAVVLVTAPFQEAARRQAAALGVSELTIVAIAHPLAYVGEEGVRVRARAAAGPVAAALQADPGEAPAPP